MADENKMITVSKPELEALIAEGIRKASAAPEGSTSRVLRGVTERHVNVRFVNNRAVVGFKNRGTETRPTYVYERPDPNRPGQTISYVDLILEGAKADEKPISLDFREFRLEAADAMCKVVRVEEKEWTLNQGIVRAKEVEEYSSVELDFEVPLDVVGKARFFIVQVPEEFGGTREVLIHEHYVNIPKA